MGKIKTFRKQRTFSQKTATSRRRKKSDSFEITFKDDVELAAFNPSERLRDIKMIGAAIMQCLIENDSVGVMEIIASHLEAMNKTKFSKDAGIPRSTMYKVLKTKNPTIKTLARIMYAAHHSSS